MYVMQMTDGEIVTRYRQAKNPKEQIKILAELNSCSLEVIKNILINAGALKPINFKSIAELYERGLSDRKIADEIEESVYIVKKWRIENNLPTQTERKKLQGKANIFL